MINVGRHTYGNVKTMFEKDADLTIGAFCSIAEGATFCLGGEHRTDCISSFPFPWKWGIGEAHRRTRGDIVVGNDVWIGAGAFIMSGVTIGDGAVIGARSVITKNVPPYSVCVGNPFKVTRTRFTKDEVEILLRVKWWDWTDEKIRENISLIMGDDVKKLAEVAGAE